MKQEANNSANRKQSASDRASSKSTDAISGESATETLEYDGGRQVAAYVPPNRSEAIVFAADGQRFAIWGRLLKKANITSTMIVGVHGLADEMPRIQLVTRPVCCGQRAI